MARPAPRANRSDIRPSTTILIDKSRAAADAVSSRAALVEATSLPAACTRSRCASVEFVPASKVRVTSSRLDMMATMSKPPASAFDGAGGESSNWVNAARNVITSSCASTVLSARMAPVF